MHLRFSWPPWRKARHRQRRLTAAPAPRRRATDHGSGEDTGTTLVQEARPAGAAGTDEQ
jgi:hypothetical protein